MYRIFRHTTYGIYRDRHVQYVPIPIYAIGGMTEDTIHQLPPGFAGICAISYFMNASLQQIQHLRKEWLKDA